MALLNERFADILGRVIKTIKNGILSLGKINPKYTINTFLIVFSGLFLFFVYNWFSDRNTVRIVNEAVERMLIKHDKEIEERNDSIRAINEGPLVYRQTFTLDHDIREELGHLLAETDADRVLLSSFHNHEEGVQLHYLFYDEAYEATNKERHVPEVAQNYQKIRTSLTPFMNFLSNEVQYSGTTKDILEIDMRYSHRMEEDNMFFGSWHFIWSETGRPIGVLSCSWKKSNRRYIPRKELIENKLYVYSEIIRKLIDKNSKTLDNEQ